MTEKLTKSSLIKIVSNASNRYGDYLVDMMEEANVSSLREIKEEDVKTYIKSHQTQIIERSNKNQGCPRGPEQKGEAMDNGHLVYDRYRVENTPRKIEKVKYKRKPAVVEVRQVDKTTYITSSAGTLRVAAGNYLVTDARGEQYWITPEILALEYELVGAPAADNIDAPPADYGCPFDEDIYAGRNKNLDR